MQKYDCIVVGCGFAGAVAARELAEKKGKKVLILDARDHVGGNCYDLPDEYGIRIHQYGPVNHFHRSANWQLLPTLIPIRCSGRFPN